MRTKTLLIAAAALAATVISSQAQVYSGIVGYATLSLTNGENLVANPLDYDGTGTNNTLQTLLSTNMPNGTKVYTFVNGAWLSVSYSAGSAKWLGAATNQVNAALNPGYGVFINIPTTLPPTNVVLTEVGQVLQGTYTNPVTAGVQILSCITPLTGTIDTNLMYAPSKGDKVYTWNQSAQNYNGTAPSYNGTKWLGGDPTLVVAQPVILSAASNNVWGVNFVAQ
jgi:hypothetical protein